MAAPRPAPTTILRGHKAQVHVAAFVRDNARLATGDAEGFVVLWDLAVMRPAVVWRAHDKAILGLEGWGQDAIITHGRDHKLVVWRLAADDEPGLSAVLPVEDVPQPRRQPWILHLLEVNALNFCAFAACAGRDGRGPGAPSDGLLLAVPNTLASEAIDIYSLPCHSRLYTVRPGFNNGMAMSLRLFYLGPCLTLVAGFENGYASVHCLNAASEWVTTYRSQVHSQPILSLDVHPSHEYFLTSSADSVVAKHPIPTAPQVLAVSLGPRGQAPHVVGTASKGGNAPRSLAQDAPKAIAEPSEEWKHPLKTVNTKHSGQQSLRVRSDGKIFATAGWDSKIRVYSCKSLKELAVLQWHKVGAYAVAFACVGGPAGPGTEGDESCARVVQYPASVPPTLPIMNSPADKGGIRNSAGMSVKDRRIRQAKETHWIVAGAKDGKVSLWDVY